jgi:hypothetical protein
VKSQQKYFQQQVDYKIDVTLNDVDKTLDGFEVINYTNNSPDTLRFIWFHLWPNAFKNDKTAFSEQLLKLGRTDFYFSDESQRGYINRLDFKVDNVTAILEQDSLNIDVAKLRLPEPLLPGKSIRITTPFHEKIPFNFSRGGYVGNTFQITQWYPKPAVYDRKGWHPMPYLDQGEFFSEFGNSEVTITVPKDYVIAASGKLQNADELNWLKEKSKQDALSSKSKVRKEKFLEATKTLVYSQNNIHDFAWFADKNFIVRYDTLQLRSGRIIDLFAYFTESGSPTWKNSIEFLKDAVTTRSKWLGEYPYDVVSAVEAKMDFSDGMEYPTITSIAPMPNEKELDLTIEHEVGHNWNYGILANNERQHPWLDEGMNTFFDRRYEKIKYPQKSLAKSGFFRKRFPDDNSDLVLRNQIKEKKDQRIETNSEDFSIINYGAIAYYKAGLWMELLQNYLGQELFDRCLHEYYDRWKFNHPYPEDFKKVVEDVSNKNVDSIFSYLYKKGKLPGDRKKTLKPALFFNFNNTDKYHYLFFSPAFGANYYDKLMVGGLLHNYTLPEPAFHFFVAPMYATGSKTFTGIGRAGLNIMSYGSLRKTEISIAAGQFSMDEFTDSTGAKNYMGFSKIVPSIKIIFRNAMSSVVKSLQWKTFFIEEESLLFSRDTIADADIISYPKSQRYLNQLTFNFDNDRALYPYSVQLRGEQAKDFMRFSFEGNYFFNYAKGGGLEARLFAGKFLYLNAENVSNRYFLNMSGANGYEDYTYSNYFFGRNEFQNLPSQQMMIRDGGFKVRTDLYFNKIGKTDNWLSAINLKTTIPENINPLEVLPFDIPLKVFLDLGTYDQAWQRDATTGKFLYDAGVQLSFFKNLLKVYVPLLYSKVYSEYYKSTSAENTFWNKISFSIDIQDFKLKKIFSIE